MKEWLRQKGISKGNLRESMSRSVTSIWFLSSYWTSDKRSAIVRTGDPVRYGSVDLAISQLAKDEIPGSVAEGGVYKGWMSKFLHDRLPDRPLYLFDTFEGFDPRDQGSASDGRFKDTSVEEVLRHIGRTENVFARKGFFPESAAGLEEERFAFVMIDFDKYDPTLAALEFFYPRTSSGGFIFVHDYSSPESDWACSRALDGFLSDKPEKPVLIPDAYGSALFRKI